MGSLSQTLTIGEASIFDCDVSRAFSFGEIVAVATAVVAAFGVVVGEVVVVVVKERKSDGQQGKREVGTAWRGGKTYLGDRR